MAISQTVLAGILTGVAALALFVLGTAPAAAPNVELACPAPLEAPQAGETDVEPLDRSQSALASYLSRRFLVAASATQTVVRAAHHAARESGLDPLLVLAVISVESRFNPVAESAMGAKGLMQIIPKFHLDKLREHGGAEAVLDPESNIRVGTRILQEYVSRFGTLEAGLQFYNGAAWDASAQYAQKVLAERGRLEAALRLALRSDRALAVAHTEGS